MDRFRLEERIGSGGMGIVYRAFDERLHRYVAVKEVMVGAPERVVREAQAAARLNHPGIVALFEFGVDGHRALLVSELIDGSTLDELAREGALCDRDVAELGADVCEALEHAHARGVVHRDVKPKNVIAREDTGAGRRAKLTDFGIASLAGAPTLTAPGEVVGTLAYMSPEQAEGEQAGPASDAYSLALTLYECWAGENPARRSTPAQTARDLGGVLPSLGDYRPDLPARLCDAIDACLVAEPDERAPLAELHSALLAAGPDLDCDYAVPAPGGHAADERPGLWVPSVSRLAGLALLALACVGLAAAGLAGLGLVAAVLGFPALIAATSVARAGLPAGAVLLGALSAGGAYPAAVAALERTPLARFAMGAIGWCWLLSASAALGIAPPAGLVEHPPVNWDASTAEAVDDLLLPLLEGKALIGMAAFAVGAAALGRILAARHLAMAAVGAVVWAAVLAAVLALVGDGGLQWAPLLIAASALVALAAEHRTRAPGGRLRASAASPSGPPSPAPTSP